MKKIEKMIEQEKYSSGYESTGPGLKTIQIAKVNSNFEREPLIRPFGFKGGYVTEIWQTVTSITSSSGIAKIGLGTQSVLWSDAKVFSSHSQSGGDTLMYAMTEWALQAIKGQSFTSPVQLLEDVLPEVYVYGKKVTSNQQLRMTFALNALVGVDNAIWLLYAVENGFRTFDEMLPKAYRLALSHHHKKAAAIPLMSY
ncbi:MAG: hypothetical protein WAW23_05495, partial [Candidatus Methanoperedens sp.]